MEKAITLLIMILLPLVVINTDSLTTSFFKTSEIQAQSAKAPVNAGKDLLKGLEKLVGEQNIRSGLHTIFTSPSGAKYCVVLKDGKVTKLIVTSSEGNQVKPKYISGNGKDQPCIICVTFSKKPLVEECWEWQCDSKK